MTASCPDCQVPFEHNARYCKRCGSARPPEPGPVQMGGQATYAPQSQQTPSPRAWPVIAAAITGFLLVAGAIVAAVLTSASDGNGVHAATVLTVTAPRPSGITAASGGSEGKRVNPNQGQPSEQTGTTPNPASTQGGVLPLTPYSGNAISAEIPTGWSTIENEAHKPGYVESKWRNPADSDDTILIDTSPATHDTLEGDAAPVHDDLLRAGGYQEISYGPGDLAGFESWMWVFRLSGDQRVDYFFNRCASGFAVLGSTVPSRFAQLAATFRSVAESVNPGERSGSC